MIEYFLAGVKVGLFGLGIVAFIAAVIIGLVILMVVTELVASLGHKIAWYVNNYRKYGRFK